MSQTWDPPTNSTNPAVAVVTKVQGQLNSLRSLHSGSSEPTSTVADMLWNDAANGTIEQRNAGDTASDTLLRAHIDNTRYPTLCGTFSSVSATQTVWVPPPWAGAKLKRILLLSKTASSSSSGNEWQHTLLNLTQASAALFSATVGNFTALGGVGGGAELAADTVYALTPDQNSVVDADDVLEFSMAKVGTVTTLATLAVIAEWAFSQQ